MIITVAIDLAKKVFSLHGVDSQGRVELRYLSHKRTPPIRHRFTDRQTCPSVHLCAWYRS